MRVRRVGNYAALLGDFWRNPNTRALTPEARSLYCDALSHAADNLTDGVVTKAALQGMHCAMHSALPIAMPLALLTAVRPDGGRFWIDLGVAIQIVGYLDSNPSKAELRAKAEHGRKAAKSRWIDESGGGSNTEQNAECNASSNASSNAECIPNPEPRTLPPELLTQNSPALNTRAREAPASKQATPAQIRRAVEDAAEALQGPPPWVEVLTWFDREWELVHGCALGVEMAASQHRLKAEGVVRWARKQAGDDWEALVSRAAAAFARGASGNLHSPFAAWASAPGAALTKRAAGPAPPRRSEEFTHDDPEEFWGKVEAENAANR